MTTERARNRVAVTGLGALTPLGIGVERFWEGLLAADSAIGPIESFDAGEHTVKIAGEVSDFDPVDWISPRDASRLDRFCHFALTAALMACEDAAFWERDPAGVATAYATGIGGAEAIRSAVRAEAEAGPRNVSPLFIPSAIPNMGAALIARSFGFTGPSVSPASACSSSADAIGIGFRMVRDGYASACLAGGSEACVVPTVVAGFANMGALSKRNDDPTGASRPFDATRDGFVLAEGAGALLLEPLDVARARGAPVYAEVCGFGQTTDAHHETAPAPGGTVAACAITAALKEAETAPDAVDYINAHGTSTQLSDVTETEAIKLALGPAAAETAISSTKSMTGHLLGAAGAVEAIAAILAVARGCLPPTINLTTPDPRCDLDYVPNDPRPATVSTALSNSMGFGGHNSCLAFRRA